MSIGAKEVAELRRRTNAGMMDCKKALTEAAGDMEKAIAFLKEWGIAKAAKKGDRGANEGIMNALISPDFSKGMLIEVNCETDFVSNTEEYKKFAASVAGMIFDKNITDVNALNTEITEKIAAGIAQFGENIIIGSIQCIAGKGIMGSYVHSNFKNATIVSIEGTGNLNQPAILAMAKDIAVHISANTVQAVDSSTIDPKVIADLQAEYTKEVQAQGKPEAIVQKIVDGKMQKFYKDETLIEQPFLKNEDISIKELLVKIGKETSTELKVAGFIKTIIGE